MDTSEELLGAWLELTVNIRGNRILKELSLNESMVLRLLLREEGEVWTASALGERLKLLKSQTHAVLAGLEERRLIRRLPGTRDKRTVTVAATEEGRRVYEREHAMVMALMDKVAGALGEEKAMELTGLIKKALAAAEAAQEV